MHISASAKLARGEALTTAVERAAMLVTSAMVAGMEKILAIQECMQMSVYSVFRGQLEIPAF